MEKENIQRMILLLNIMPRSVSGFDLTTIMVMLIREVSTELYSDAWKCFRFLFVCYFILNLNIIQKIHHPINIALMMV